MNANEPTPSDSRSSVQAELAVLRAENRRLARLLQQHGIKSKPAEAARGPKHKLALIAPAARLSAAERVALFRGLFRGRTDTYPVRWEAQASRRSGYAPACGNEWRPGICEKPRVKCSACPHRLLLPITDDVIYRHLAGEHTVGLYPLLDDDTCHLLALDFDDEHWRDDAQAFRSTCTSLGVPVALEISRSGQGAHAWIFFDRTVAARDARRLGTALISHTCARTRQLKLDSYDRLFPSQDTVPKGGFGNLIALPLQRAPREHGHTVFVDEAFDAYPDQWTYLASIARVDARDVEPLILRASRARIRWTSHSSATRT